MSPSGTGNTAPGFTMATVLFILWAFCSYVVRAWTKYKKTDVWGHDDTALTFSLVAAVFHVAAALYGVHRGYGGQWAKMSESDMDAVSKAFFVGQLLFVISTGATRVSAAAFSARVLTMDRRQQQLANGLVGLCGLWTIGATVGVAIRSPLAHPWTTLDGSQAMYARWLAVETTGIFLDLASLALSVVFIWQLQMTVAKRLAVCAIFAVRLGTLPVIVCRLWALAPGTETAARADIAAGVLTEAEMCLALILASAVCLKPFLQPFHPGWFVAKTNNTTGLTGNHSGSNTKRSNYYELSGVRSEGGVNASRDRKQKAVVSVTNEVDPRDDGASDELDLIQAHDKAHHPMSGLRPDGVEHRATAFHPPSPVAGMHVSNHHGHHGDGREDVHHISKSQDWSVTYE